MIEKKITVYTLEANGTKQFYATKAQAEVAQATLTHFKVDSKLESEKRMVSLVAE